MLPANEGGLRTRVYIDGYNLYYGCLKKTAHRWLDLRQLVVRVLANVPFEREGAQVGYALCTPAVKYFTAPILSSFARSEDSVPSQTLYHSALRGHLGDELEIIPGYYEANEPCRPLGDRIPIEMCSSEESARELMNYLRQQAVKCCV